jgi:hypothetical protein
MTVLVWRMMSVETAVEQILLVVLTQLPVTSIQQLTVMMVRVL